MSTEFVKIGEERTVEIRFHRGNETLVANRVFNYDRPHMWPRSQTLETGPLLVQVRASRERYDSWVLINSAIVWQFTWQDTNAWTVEEFLYDGIVWRLEYRTRWPVLDEGTT